MQVEHVRNFPNMCSVLGVQLGRVIRRAKSELAQRNLVRCLQERKDRNCTARRFSRTEGHIKLLLFERVVLTTD